MSQADAILAKFPGPVMLSIPTGRRLLGLLIGLRHGAVHLVLDIAASLPLGTTGS